MLLEKDKAYDSHEKNRLVALADPVSFKLNKINVERTLGLVRKELGNEEDLFSLFVDHIPAAVFIKDHNSRYIFMNRFLRNVIGHDESHLGKEPHELYSNEIADLLLEYDRKPLKEGFIECEEKVSDKSQALRLYSSLKFVINRHRKEPLIGGIVIDINGKRDYQSRFEYFIRIHHILRETTKELLRTELLEETYKVLLKRAVEIFPEAESGSLFLKKKDGKYHFDDAINYDKEILKETTFEPDEIPTLSDEILKRANRAKKEKENQDIATTILLDA